MIRRHPWRTTFLLLLAVLLGAGGVIGVMARRDLEPVQNTHRQQVVVSIGLGEPLSSVVSTLGQDRLVRSRLFFQLYAEFKGLGSNLHPGKYILDRGMGPSELVAVLEGPPAVLPVNITVPDGLRAQQEAALLQSDGLFSAASYMTQIRSGQFSGISQLAGAPTSASWEGMAFGDTYQVNPSISAKQFLQLQLQDFERRLAPTITAGDGKVGLTPYQVVVLASIVEAEANTQKDRNLVAGVFFNRLRQGMPLQSDVTILYAMAAAGQSGAPFSTAFPSPYNTYAHTGLPPGPIDSPGSSAISAVLSPTASNYLYFVSLPNGKMLFAVTAAQHQQQVQQAGLG